MWPKTVRKAFTRQMQAELAIRELAEQTFNRWTPVAQEAVFSTALVAAGEPPVENILATRGVWYSVMDALFLHGLGQLYAWEMVTALAALGVALPEGDPDAVPDSIPMEQYPGIDTAALNAIAVDLVAAALGITVAELAAAAATTSVRPYQAAYLASVRNRMQDVPEETFRALTRSLDEALELGEGPEKMRVRVADELGIDAVSRRAVTIARTESAGAMTSSVIDAAKATGEDQLEKTWVATMDKRTRKSHFRADGQRIGVDGKFQVGRAELRFPGDPRGPAHETINCRCAVFILRADEPDPGELGRESKAAGEVQAEIDRRAEDGQIRARDQGLVASPIQKESSPMPMFREWTAVLAEVGVPTDDGRMLAQDIDLSFRTFPLPLMWQKQSEPGHYSSFAVGVIESAELQGNQVLGRGYMLNTPEANEAVEEIGHGVSRPSVDLGSAEWMLTDEQGNEIDFDDWWDDNLPEGTKVVETMLAAKLLGATLVSIPAFGGVSITMTGQEVDRGSDEKALVASLVASGNKFLDEFTPRRELFDNPHLSELTPVTYDPETGRVFGHLALWGKKHIAVKEEAPTSPSGYRYFHTSHINTDQGPMMVGKLTVATGHAGLRLCAGPAAEHYDNTGSCWAYVCAGEDAHGVWVSGVIHPFATQEKIHDGLASPLSGDWREINGHYELVAGLSVNVPGFPLVAGLSAPDGSVHSLVAALGPRPAQFAEGETSTQQKQESTMAFEEGSTVRVKATGDEITIGAVAEAVTAYQVESPEEGSPSWYVEAELEAIEDDSEDDAPPPPPPVDGASIARQVALELRAMDKRNAAAASLLRNREAKDLLKKLDR